MGEKISAYRLQNHAFISSYNILEKMFVRTYGGDTTDFPINIGLHQGVGIGPLFICFGDG